MPASQPGCPAGRSSRSGTAREIGRTSPCPWRARAAAPRCWVGTRRAESTMWVWVYTSRKQLTAVQPSDRKGAIVVTVAGARPSMVKLEPSAWSALLPGESAALKHGGQPAAAVPGSGSQPPEPASRAKQRRRGRGPGGFPRRRRWPRSQTIPNGRATTTKGRRLRRTGATTPQALSRSP